MRYTIGALIFVLSAISFAHHSDIEYDRNDRTELTGEVTAVLWRNPHVSLTVQTPEGDLWRLEGDNPNLLARFGVPRDAVLVGDQIRVAGYPSTRRENQMWFSTIYRGEEPVSTDDFSAGESGFSDEAITASIERSNGIFRVWGWNGPTTWPEELPLREAARTARTSWNLEDDPARSCNPHGMPRAIIHNPFPIEFVEPDDGTVRLYLTEFDAYRTIHMDQQLTEKLPATPLGYSVGEWEDDVLVVRTTNVDYPLFNRTGTPQSEEVEMLERFRVSNDQLTLRYEITVDDPVTFTAPVTLTKSWAWLPGRERLPYDAECLND